MSATTRYELRSAGSIRELKAMLDRVQAQHLDLPLEFWFFNRDWVCQLQHMGRAGIPDDAVVGDKAAFVEPKQAPTRAVIVLAVDAAAQTAFENEQRNKPLDDVAIVGAPS